MPHDRASLPTPVTRRRLLQGALSGAVGGAAWSQGWPHLRRVAAQQQAPSGQLTWAIHVTIAPTWFDPAETQALATPYMMLYAIHDAMLKPMPGNPMTPCLATQWSESDDGLTYDFALRQGVTFHNGDPFTAEDVQFSFERYRGAGAGELKRRVQALEIVHPYHVRFRLQEPWPDFMTFYGSIATGAGWIVPKKYVEKVGDAAFKTQPIGLGPYRVVSQQPGIELVLEAHTAYWRKTPLTKRLVFKSVPEATTRLAMLKRGEADVAYALYGPLAEEVRSDPTLKFEPVLGTGTQWVTFVDQYDPKSPWADTRVRLAANHAVNWQAINEAETLGSSFVSGGLIPRDFDFALPLEAYGYDPKKARQLLTAAGYPHGFDAGEMSIDLPYATLVEAIVNDLTSVGIRAKARSLERAAFHAGQVDKSLKHLIRQGSGAFGNAASRIEAFLYSKGSMSFLKDPEIDAWYEQQLTERDRTKREALLHKIQQKAYDEARFMPIWQLSFVSASGPRAAVSGLRLIQSFLYSAPYEDVQMKSA